MGRFESGWGEAVLREPDPSLTALSLEGVSKRFHRGLEEVVALDEVDLQVAAGEFLALVGPSGSGKSTLLHIAGGLDRPDSGRVLVGDDDLATLSAADRARLRRRRVGFVFQFFHLIPTLSVAENVALPLTLDRARRVDAPVLEMLDRVGLAPRAGHLPGELSGGEMQRAAIARALVSHPALILADEPTGNLDSATGEAILDLMTERVRETGAALLMVTHDLGAAARADRSLSLRDGRVSAAVSSPGPGARSRGRTKGATTGDDAVTGAVTGTLTGAGAAAAAAAGAEPVRER
ncbi:MAG: ABC transporter ATP-binding protein [Actinobacteria bacterium]|nr:MAG: ABC transporter ATP-binding protein [Actinomycetota bacterium]